MTSFSDHRWVVAGAALLSALAFAHDAFAQGSPPFAQQQQPQSGGAGSPICQRLIGQLSSIDSNATGGDSAKADQIRRYEDAQNRQQQELDRVQQQARNQGCDSSGFFSMFGGGNSEKCGPLNTRIQQMRQNLDQINSSLGTLRAGNLGNPDRDGQRRSVLTALAQNNCGPQYANAARDAGAGGFFQNLFGGVTNPGGEYGAAGGTYRTVCARTCDGFYFPVSFATVPSRFADDEKTCKQLCPNAEVTLYSYKNPGEDMNSAVSLSGQPYSASPNAFKYRQAFDKSCSCRAAGQSWSDAMKHIDERDSISQGDIIVTDESSKKMAQPPKGPAPKKPATAPAATTAAPAASDSTAATPASGEKPIRSVGPTFIPAR
ncbi:MAG: DUF2865 domain-containing protein [Pseudomonadota bacterium]